MKPSSLTRKQRNLYTLLFVAMVLSTNAVQAQSFDPLSPVETLVQEVADGTAQIVQFEDLQAFAMEQQLKSGITELANDEATDVYLDQVFNVDGDFGETKDGLIIEDWDIVAKAMGTSAAVAAGVYSLWYRRRRDYLTRLRNGDVALIEDLFEHSIINLENFNTADWEAWAIKKGIPGSGVLLLSLFGVWSRRQQRSLLDHGAHKDLLLTLHDDFEVPTSYSNYRTAVLRTVYSRQARETENAVAAYTFNNPAPIKPVVPAELAKLQNLPAKLIQGVDFSALGKTYSEALKYGNGISNVYSLMTHYPNDFPVDTVAREIVKSMEALQAAATVLLNKNNSDFSSIYLGTTYNNISGKYRTLQNKLTTWLNTNRSKINPHTQTRLSQLRYEYVFSKQNKYIQQAVELQSVLAEQKKYSTLKAAWEASLLNEKRKISAKYADVSGSIYGYWRSRYEARSDQGKQQTYLSDLAEESTEYLAALELKKKTQFGVEILDYLQAGSTAHMSDAVTQFLGWTEQSGLEKNYMSQRFDDFLAAHESVKIIETELLDSALTWSQKKQKEEQLAKAQSAKAEPLDQIWKIRSVLLSTAEDSGAQQLLQSQMLVIDSATSLEKNEVYKWLTEQEANKKFAAQYGIYDREEYLTQRISDLEENIDFAILHNASQVSGVRGSVSDAKRELESLKNGALPDMYWSPTYWGGDYIWGRHIPYSGNQELNAFITGWRNKGTNYTARQTDVYKQKLVERDKLVSTLATERVATWQSQQTEILESKFTEAEITAYQSLRKTMELVKNKSESLVAAETDAVIQYQAAIAHNNETYVSRQQVTTGIFIPFDAADLQAIALSAETPVAVPDFLSDVYFESYRRFQNDKAAFGDEVKRLTIQAKAIARLDQITKRSIPNPPVQTKEVRDYLSDPQRTADDVDRAIAEVRTGIEILKAEQLDPSTSTSRKSYLTTALTQADNKIAALERYKALGPVATEAYLTAVKNYEAKYALTLQEVDHHLDEKYQKAHQYVDTYWNIASDLLAQKQAENDYVPTDPSLVELVDPAPTEAEIQANLEAGWANLISKMPTFNPAALNAKVVLKNTTNSETWDSVTNARIKQLNPAIGATATAFINQVEKELGIRLRVSNGTRSFQRQSELYAQGRTTVGNIVTHAQAGLSYHNYGQAIDVVEIQDGVANYDLDWAAIGKIGKQFGFEWGGDWSGFTDKPHFHMTLGKTPQELLTLRSLGQLVDDIYYDATAVARQTKAAEIEETILTNIETGESLTATNTSLFGPRLDPELQNYVFENPDRVEAIIMAGTDDDTPRWEIDAWVELMISAIRSGERDFIDFTGSEKAELEALIVAAKDSKGWLTLGVEAGRLKDFIEAVDNITEYEARKQKTNDLLMALNLATTVGGIALNFNIRNLIFDAIRDNDSFLSIKNLLEAFLQAQNNIASNNVSNPQVFANSFQADLQSFIDTFQPPIREYTYEQTKWHFEDRAALNSNLPTHEEIIADNLLQESLGKDVEWLEFPSAQNKAHDNDFGEPEIKFVHRDGREAIFDGDSFSLVTDADLMGTYNYINAMPLNTVTASNLHEFITSGIGHLIVDYLPYKTLGGNVR